MAEIKGGSKLQARLAEIAQNAKNAATVSVGFLEGSRYSDGTSVPMVAAVQEYGSTRAGRSHKVIIPPRPFFRTAIKEESPHWPDDVAALLKAHDYDAKATLTDMGEEISAEIKVSINEWQVPPNAPATVAKKGFNKPLIGGKTDSSPGGFMRDSVHYRVK